MKKLVMKLEDLRVDSFRTGPEMTDRRGTVKAHGKDSNTCLPESEWCGWSDMCTALCSDQCVFSVDIYCETADIGCQ